MFFGLLAGTAYLYAVRWGGMEPWLYIDHLRFGIIGASVSLVAMIVVSLATAEPDEETQRMVDEVRIPRGESVIDSRH
jgi:cation/acetate symporter